MLRSLCLTTVAAAAVCLLTPARVLAEPKHPHLHHALFEMREASQELSEVSHDFHGHRDRAIAALDAAVRHTEAGLAAVGDPFDGYTPDKGLYERYDNHPHLRQSLAEMRDAQKALKAASHNFGGHRAKAIEALDVAIKQVQKCIQFAK